MQRADSHGKTCDVFPQWMPDGVPWCAETCPAHDGKRCAVTGSRAGDICEPGVSGAVLALLDMSRCTEAHAACESFVCGSKDIAEEIGAAIND